jgi:hypothetical protein
MRRDRFCELIEKVGGIDGATNVLRPDIAARGATMANIIEFWAHGDAGLPFWVAERLCAAAGVSLDWLAGRGDAA